MRILVVEDEIHLNRIISEAMSDEGYSVDCCFNGKEALEYCSGAVYDLIILDIMMPVMDGLTFVKRFRSEGGKSPVLFLTARDSIADKVEGLESGGDYYLVKPFNYDELIAVAHAMLRKYSDTKSNILTVEDLTLDITTRQVRRADKDIELSTKEFALLEHLMRHKGMVVSRESIENSLWNYDYEGGSNVIDVYIGYLRKKMDTGFDTKLIHTVWGTGWRLGK